MRTDFIPAILVAAACLCTPALAHNHLTVDTVAGTPQKQAVIRAGYQPSESAYSIANNRLLYNGSTAVYAVTTPLTGLYDGWYGGSGLTLTSDYYASSGRLDGGNFAYEIAAVYTVSGYGTSSFVWGTFDGLTGEFIGAADSQASSREARSFIVGAGTHPHGQGYITTGGWVVDVVLVAWDTNGVYADSPPVRIRFDNGRCPADFNRTFGVTVQDVFDFLIAWLQGDPAADFNHINGLTVQDIFDFLTVWLAGC